MESSSISFDFYRPKPVLVVISGPSGVGKDSVLNGLKKRGMSYHFVITAASRAPRENEKDGVDYFFYSKETFERMIQAGEFIEYANVYDEYKGVPRRQIDEALASGKDVVMRLDVQGAATMRSKYPESILIFLIASNDEEWRKRLVGRHTETPESLELRLNIARKELDRIREFDYVVVNAEDKLEEAVNTVIAIIESEHHRIIPRNLKQ